METAGHFIGVVVKFTAGVQYREDHFRRRNPLFVHIGRNASAVVLHRHRLIGVDGDHNALAVAGQGLVNGVIDDFKHHVVQAGAVIGVSDIHARSFANGI